MTPKLIRFVGKVNISSLEFHICIESGLEIIFNKFVSYLLVLVFQIHGTKDVCYYLWESYMHGKTKNQSEGFKWIFRSFRLFLSFFYSSVRRTYGGKHKTTRQTGKFLTLPSQIPSLPLSTCQLIKFYPNWFTQIVCVNRFDEIFLYGWYNLLCIYP